MKKLILLLIFIPVLAFGQGMQPVGHVVTIAGGSCTTSSDEAIFDYTGGGSTYEVDIISTANAGQKYTLSGTWKITEYKISITDVNNEGSLKVALYTDAAGTSMISGTDVTIAASSIAAGPGIVTFTLATPKTGVSGTIYALAIGTGTGTPSFKTYSTENSGKTAIDSSTEYSGYSVQIGVWGCSE